MINTDVAIVGGGLAGSLAAAMLGTVGIAAALIDPHKTYPPDFRCEKIDGPQTAILQRTGLADPILQAAVHDRFVWIAKYGRLAERRASDQRGIRYEALVNTVRGLVPESVPFLNAKATAITTSDDLQTVALSNGETVSARLIMLANGLNTGLRDRLGLKRVDISPAHSVSIGFGMVPVGRPAFSFPALTYYAERPSDRLAYITLFPIGSVMRANFMTYRDPHDPWLKSFHDDPEAALLSVMPGLKPMLGAFAIEGPVKIRPADLYRTQGFEQAGFVLAGDAFGTSCPAAGTGLNKVFTDVERLCNRHIPEWLGTDGMGVRKIAAFYKDPVKRSCDRRSLEKAFRLRALCTSKALHWRFRRAARFVVHRGADALTHMRPAPGAKQAALGATNAGLPT